jgi:hypothetical protein
VFAVAVWLRLQSVKVNEEVAAAHAPASSSGSSESLGVPRRADETAATTATASASATPRKPEELRGTEASARDQRYRELLNAPVTGTTGAAAPGAQKAAASQPAEEPSLLDRAVNSVAEAIGVRKPQPPPQSANAGRRQPPQSQQSPAQQDNNPRKDEQPKPGQRPDEERADKDQEADTVAPRLLTAEFIPNQVQDGEQTTFAVTASDDLSGVRSVSGVIVSPSGAQQGFALQREGDQRFSTRITVPREAAEGRWLVKYLTIMDNASNAAQLTSLQGSLPPTAAFTVMSSSSDSKGPTLKALWLEKPSMQAGEKNMINVQVDDDRSGVGLVSGVFISPQKQGRIGFGCRYVSGDMWQCPITPPACVDCGAWQLEQVQLQDKANNMTTLRGDNQLVQQVQLQLFGEGCDSAPPQLTSIVLDPTSVANGQQNTIKVTIVATDDQCGVASLSGRAAPPPNTASQAIHFPMRPTGDGQTFVGEISLHPNSANGVWSINWVQALDKGHNQKTYTPADPVVARATFTVE